MNLSSFRLAGTCMQLVTGVLLFLLHLYGLAVITNSDAYAFNAENHDHDAVPSVSGSVTTSRTESTVSIQKALEAYDRAFQAGNLDALQQIFAHDIVMYEQGTQNIGKVDVLTNHLGPELRTFQEMTANYTDIRIRESGRMAIITRQFSLQGKRQQGRPFYFRGSETQGWELRDGRWQLTHLHLSFPPSR